MAKQSSGGNKKRVGGNPAKKRYNTERRWEKNKDSRIARQARLERKKQEKLKRRKGKGVN